MNAALVLFLLGGLSGPAADIAQVTVQLRLESAISTGTARAGDAVRLRTVNPFAVDGRPIPPGCEVRGVVTRSKRPGRVRGRGELDITIVSIVLLDGTVVPVTARPATVEQPRSTRPRGATRPPPIVPILAGMAAGYGTAWLVSRGSDSAETIARSGVVAGVTTGVLVGVLKRGADLELRPGRMLDVVIERTGRQE